MKEQTLDKLSVLKPCRQLLWAQMRVAANFGGRRILALTSAFLVLLATLSPETVLAAQVAAKPAAPMPDQPKQKVRKGPREVKQIVPRAKLASDPTDAEIERLRVFLEPLVPMHKTPVTGENRALAQAISVYSAKSDKADLSDLKKFLSEFPQSRWSPSLMVNVADKRYEDGFFSEALAAWKEAWTNIKSENEPAQKAVADEAISRALCLEACVGMTEELEANLKEIEKRPVFGTIELRVQQAKEGLRAQKERPTKSFKCGPYAINSILNLGKTVQKRNEIVNKTNSTKKGTNLAQVKELADKVGLRYQMAKRNPGAKQIVPAVVHYKLSHFAAVTEQKNNRYHLTDPTFSERGNMWLTADALEAETDGYSLVPAGPLPAGWEPVDEKAAAKIWGKGFIGSSAPNKTPTCPIGSPSPPPKKNPSPPAPGKRCTKCGCQGMAVASAFMLNTTLKIQDSPVGYSPAVGPSIDVLLNYSHLEGEQPGTFSFTNFGQDWSVNWLSYLTVDSSKNATVRVRGGGYETFNYTVPDNVSNPYLPDLTSQAVLTVASAGVYQRQLPDGSIEVFSQPDSAGRFFMTQVIDPQGNSAYVQYDSDFRLISITDAIGQVTTFTYLSNTMADPGFYKVAQITDPFGRSASFGYDASQTFLTSITDTIGIKSQFTYDESSSFINSLTTPYGTTSFVTYSYGDGLGQNVVVLKFIYPDQSMAVLRSMVGEFFWQTDYWDRESMMLFPLDYTTRGVPSHSQTTVWESSVSYVLQPIPDSEAVPLLATTSYTYAGEGITDDGDHNTPGHINKPATVVQGSETSNFEYNALGHVTKSVDPVGRTFTYKYDANNIDLLESRQTRGGNNDLNGKWIYNNSRHLPNKYIDGSGQVTQYAYNNFGQLTTLTDATGDVTKNAYNSDGLLMQTDGPMPGSSDVTSFTYDGYNRLFSSTDPQGYSIYLNYDDADRITKITYPDGTTEETAYDKLDAVLKKDRLGRWTQDSYDALDQIRFEIDPLGRETQYSWCACGSMDSLTDPNGHVTTFQHDQLGRLTSKTRNDTTKTSYNYDTYGNVSSRVDAKGQETDYSYNLDNTLKTVSYHAPLTDAPVNYVWDPNYQRLVSVQNGWGTITYAYNPYIADPFAAPITGGGMLASVSNNVIPNSEVTYQYDALGRTTQRQINGSSNSVSWIYDAMSRITSESNALGTFNFHYVDDYTNASRGDTRLSSISYPNGQTASFNYFGNLEDKRLLGITNLDPAGKVRSQFNYSYDPAGQIVAWAQQNSGRSPVQYDLSYDRAGQLTAARGNLGGQIPDGNQYFYSYDPSANRTSSQNSTIESLRLMGSVTAGDVLTVTVKNTLLSGGQEAVSYTVLSGDTLSSIASNFAAAITSDSALMALGVNATSDGSLVKIKAASPEVTSFSQSTSSSATETLSLGLNANSVQNAAVSLLGDGYQSQSGDVLTITVFDSGLSGGSESASYTVPSNGTALSTIAAGVASAVNADSGLTAVGVSASSAGNVVSMQSTSLNLTTYASSVSPSVGGGSETVAFSANVAGNTEATIGGSATTGDKLLLSVRSPYLTGGMKSVVYSVPDSSSTSSIAASLSSAINGDTSLLALSLSASAAGSVVALSSSPTYAVSKSSGATETITAGTNANGNISIAVGGTVTAGDSLTIQTSGGGLTAAESSSYTVLSGDSVGSIAAALTAALNADSSLRGIGLSAQQSGSNVDVRYDPRNPPTYSASVLSGANETIALSLCPNSKKVVAIGGSKTTADVLTLVVYDEALAGGSESVTYTVLSSDSLSTIAAGLTSAVNGDSALQAIGVSSTSSAALLTLQSNSTNVTHYGQGTSSGATETVTIGLNPNGAQTAVVTGSKTPGDVLTLNVLDSGLSGGKESVSYTVLSGDTLSSIAAGLATAVNGDTALSAIGVTAAAVSSVLNLSSTSINLTTYQQSASSGATAALAMSTGTSVVGDSYNDVNELMAREAVGAAHFEGSTNKPVKSVSINTSVIEINGAQKTKNSTYTTSTTSFSITPITTNYEGNQTFEMSNFNYNAGNVLKFTTHNAVLPGGQETVSHTSVTSESGATVASAIASAINGDAELQALGMTASTGSLGGVATLIIAIVDPTYTASTSSGATETVSVGQNVDGNLKVSVGGIATAGDTVTITAHFPSFSGGQESVTYTVLSSDDVNGIAAKLSTLINADSALRAQNIQSNSAFTADLRNSQTWFGPAPLNFGQNLSKVTAFDGDNHLATDSSETLVNAYPSGYGLVYDFNGNLLSDGTNSYQWDAENRLVKIIYPGTANYSEFAYDGNGRCVFIEEVVNGSSDSTKQLLWTQDELCEERSQDGILQRSFYSGGEMVGDSRFFFCFNHLQSLTEADNNAGASQSIYLYDAYGRESIVQNDLGADFHFGSYYYHQRSSFCLTLNRLYSPSLARWLSADPLEADYNSYAYVNNNPLALTDYTGLAPVGIAVNPATGVAVGGAIIAIGLGLETLAALSRIYKNAEGIYEPSPTVHGNSLRKYTWAYTYEIDTCPLTNGTNSTGIYKYGIGNLDPGYTRLNSQLSQLGSSFHGHVLELFRSRLQARIAEYELIFGYYSIYKQLPPGNKKF